MKQTTLSAQPRTIHGSAAVRRLRRSGSLPAVVYGEGKPGLNVALNQHDFVMLLQAHRSENMILELAVEGTDAPYKVMVKALQHHPITGRIIHVDFYEISMSRPIQVEVPITLVGQAVGVEREGGLLEHILRTLQVECLPADLMEEIELDVTALTVGKSLRVQDVQMDPDKFTVMDDAEQVIVSVAAPRVEAEETAEEDAAAVAAEGEPEVIDRVAGGDSEEEADKDKEGQ